MTSILVVCTGNICRSPIAEGMLRDALRARFGDAAPTVSSAGTAGLDGAGPTPEAVTAAAEHGVDIAGHRARSLDPAPASDADLLLAMAGEHRDILLSAHGDLDRTFTLKELVRLLESLPHAPAGSGPASLGERVSQAAAARRAGHAGNPLDEDIVDPIGMPLLSYRAVAWELDRWIGRLVDGLYGAVPAQATTEG
jgi:protein-tyrosine phosphatase